MQASSPATFSQPVVIKSIAMQFSSTWMCGCRRTRAARTLMIAAPVKSPLCRMRRTEWPPSRPKSYSASASRGCRGLRSKRTPQLSRAPMRATPAVMMARAGSAWVSPAPATSVSCRCASMVSSCAMGTAIPPWAWEELLSSRVRLAQRITCPCGASSSAADNPARPAPMTRKSQSSVFIMRPA